LDFTAFHREVDIRAGVVAGDDVEFRADGFFQEFWQVVSRRCRAFSAAFGRHVGFADVLDGFVRRVAPHIEQMMRHGGVADPGKFLPVELDFFAADQLIEVERGLDRADSEAVGLRYRVNLIGRNHGSHTRHVLHDDIGRAGNMFHDELADQTRVEIVNASRRRTGHESDGFTLIEGRLGVR